MPPEAETLTQDPVAAPAGSETMDGASTEAAATGTPALEGAPAADVVRPANLPESFWDAATKAPKYGDIAARLTKADELEAAATARSEGVPAEPKDYVFKPDGEPIKLADGSEAAIDPANPLAQAVAAVAHKNGLPQAAVSELARAFIETNLAGDAEVDAAVAAEHAKLGDKATERVTAVETFLKAQGATDDQIGVLRGFPTLVPLLEGLQTKLTGAAMTAAPSDGKPVNIAASFYPNMPAAKAA